ncbi:MAG: TolC family protein [Flavobacteriales bacterium]
MKYKVEQNKMLPNFSFEYGRQTTDNATFSNYRLSVGIPLWFKPQKSRINAAKTQIKINREKYNKVKLRLTQKYEKAFQSYKKHKAELEYYEQKGLNISKELIKNANKSFEAGEIDYVEYVEFIDQATDI